MENSITHIIACCTAEKVCNGKGYPVALIPFVNILPLRVQNPSPRFVFYFYHTFRHNWKIKNLTIPRQGVFLSPFFIHNHMKFICSQSVKQHAVREEHIIACTKVLPAMTLLQIWKYRQASNSDNRQQNLSCLPRAVMLCKGIRRPSKKLELFSHTRRTDHNSLCWVIKLTAIPFGIPVTLTKEYS